MKAYLTMGILSAVIDIEHPIDEIYLQWDGRTVDNRINLWRDNYPIKPEDAVFSTLVFKRSRWLKEQELLEYYYAGTK